MFYLFKIPSFIHKLYPSYLWKMPSTPRAIYLTFDDGPTPQVTDWILQTLKKYEAKATFFCKGQNLHKHPSIFKKIVDAEHQIGNHSYSHYNGWNTKDEIYISDANKAENAIEKSLKEITKNSLKSRKLFRPPYGRIKLTQAKTMQDLGYTIVMMDVVSGDFDRELNPQKSLKKIIKHTKSGSIIVFHDSEKAFRVLQDVLPKALKIWSNKGYSFLPII